MIFSREGFKALRFIIGVTLAGIAVAIFLAAGSYLYWQAETKGNQQSQRSLQDLQGRVNSLRLEREDLRNSDTTYLMVISRGAFAAEQRLDLVEALNALRIRHKLASMEYEVSPQRALRMATGQSYPAIDVLGSRIKIRIQTYHDGDLMAFLDEFPRLQRGFFPLERCAIKRTRSALQKREAASQGGTQGSKTQADLSAPSDREAPPSLEAECIAEWVTLMDKAKPQQAKTSLSLSGNS